MFQYQNKKLAYLFQVIWSIGWISAVIIFGFRGNLFVTLIALRPFLLKTEPFKREEVDWEMRYYSVLYSVVATSCAVIILYLISRFFVSGLVLFKNRYEIIFIIILPLFLLMHGIISIIYLIKNSDNKIILK